MKIEDLHRSLDVLWVPNWQPHPGNYQGTPEPLYNELMTLECPHA